MSDASRGPLGEQSALALRVADATCRAAASLAMSRGTVVLIGWMIDSDVLRGAIGVPITIKANTAVCFILIGAALRLVGGVRPRAPALGRVLATIAAAIGGVTVLEHLTGWNSGLDTLLFDEAPGAAATIAPGRMGPPAATSFLLLGTSIALLDRTVAGGRHFFRYLPLLTASIAIVPLIGYGLGLPGLYARGTLTGIAWPTAIGLFALSLGAVAARRSNRIVELLAARNVGGSIARRLLLPSLALPLLLLLAYSVARLQDEVDNTTARALVAVAMMILLTGSMLLTAYRLALTAERQARAEDALRRNERELSDFFENAVVGMNWTGPDGTILRANRAELELLGYLANEYVGRSIRDFHVDAATADDVLRRLHAGEVLRDYPARLRAKDGSIREVLIDSSVLRENGRFVHSRCFTRDVTDERSAEVTRRRLSAIVESSNDAIVGKNLDGIVTSWNRGAERLFGWTAAEMVGSSILCVIPEDRADEEHEILARIRSGQNVEIFEAVRRRKDGELIHVSLSISPILDADGRVIGASKIARDVTERKRIEAERERLLVVERHAREEAEQAARMRDEFLAVVSHELRTPLQSMLGWIRLLTARPDVPAEIGEGLQAIERAAQAQVKLVEDLLDMNRIMSGRLQLEFELVDLPSTIELAVATLRPAAENKGIRLRTVLDPQAGPVMGDPARLQQVVWNLVSNSVKFTPRGGQVTVQLERSGSEAQILVRDDGVGIPAEFLPQLFQRFRQADASTTRNHGGLGLGLSIVKQLVELHGGTVGAHSEGEGQGATFVVRLPVAAAREKRIERVRGPAAAAAPDDDQVNLAGVKVLVVDDDHEGRELVRQILTQCGAEVETAASAREGLEKLQAHKVDVLVSDVGMPQTDGYEFLRQVRGLPREFGGAVPALALTAFARSEDRMRAMLAGFQMHVAKPIEPRELVASVASFAGRIGAGK